MRVSGSTSREGSWIRRPALAAARSTTISLPIFGAARPASKARCKSCKRRYRATCRERLRVQNRASRLRHRGAINARRRERYCHSPEKERARARDWQRRNRAKHGAARARYYRNNRDRILARVLAYFRDHPEVARSAARKRRRLKKQAPGSHTATDVLRQYQLQGGLCFWCGYALNGRYHVDHIIPLSRGGDDGPDNLVVACAGCNQRKHAKLPADFLAELSLSGSPGSRVASRGF